MSILDQISDASVWREFYLYKTEKAHISGKDALFFESFIRQCGWQQLAARTAEDGFNFSVPEKRLINKLGTDKKRVVYSFTDEENAVLKLIAFLLYRYDGCFSDNLYSFRRGVGAKAAITRMTAVARAGECYCLKLDIKNYFNSIDIQKLLPMLREVLCDDAPLYGFFERLLTLDKAVWEGEVICEKRGVMAGTPVSPFFANIFLRDLDAHFAALGAYYARYSDDIVLLCPDRETLEAGRDYILSALASHGLEVNPDKVNVCAPGESWEYLGVEYRQGEIDIAASTIRKTKGKIRRKARALYRWKLRRGVSDEKAMSVFARVFNKKFFDNPALEEFTWARWFFPLVSVTDGMKTLDAYLQANMRYVACGRYSKANYRITYDALKACGYRSLVHEYYLYKQQKSAANQ